MHTTREAICQHLLPCLCTASQCLLAYQVFTIVTYLYNINMKLSFNDSYCIDSNNLKINMKHELFLVTFSNNSCM